MAGTEWGEKFFTDGSIPLTLGNVIGEKLTMPIIKSAKKQVRSSARRKKANADRRKAIKGTVRSAHDKTTPETLSAAFKALDKAANRHTIHRNKAARLKSRLSRKLRTV